MRIGPFVIGRHEPLRAQTVQEQLANRVMDLKDELAATVLETVDMMASYVDPSERFRGPDGSLWIPVGGAQDGRSSSDKSNFSSEQELTAAREYCRWLAAENPYAINLHENLVSYIVGTGPRVTIAPRQGEEVGDDAIKTIQDAFNDWLWESDWACRQQESVVRFDRDGEYFRRFFTGEDGEVQVRFVEPNQVSQPEGGNANSFMGVQTAPGDVETVEGYWVDGQIVPAEEIQHVKANVDANVRRGRPTTWAIREQLRMAVRVQMNIGKVSIIQTKIALIQRYPNATKSGVESLRSTNADYTTTNPVTGKTTTVESMQDGSIIRAKAGTEYEYPAGGVDVEKFGAGAQMILRSAAARVCFPEFMFTSDASNANYASTMVAEGPAVRMFQRRQETQKQADLAVYWKVLESKAAQGLFDASLLERIEVLVEAPTVQVRDQLQEAQTFEIYDRMGVVSKQTICGKLGLDYKQEQKNISEWEKDHPKPEPLMSPGGFGDPLGKVATEARLAMWQAGGLPE